MALLGTTESARAVAVSSRAAKTEEEIAPRKVAAPKGQNLNSLGRQPQVGGRKSPSKPRRGDTRCAAKNAAPSGLGIIGGLPYLGLAPQAIQILPLRGVTPRER